MGLQAVLAMGAGSIEYKPRATLLKCSRVLCKMKIKLRHPHPVTELFWQVVTRILKLFIPDTAKVQMFKSILDFLLCTAKNMHSEPVPHLVYINIFSLISVCLPLVLF